MNLMIFVVQIQALQKTRDFENYLVQSFQDITPVFVQKRI